MANVFERGSADEGKRGFLKLLFFSVIGATFGAVVYPIIRYLSPLARLEAHEKV